MVLAGVAVQEWGKTAAAAAPPVKLVLVYAAEPTARIACESIARQLELVGLQVSLNELPGGQPPGSDFDLLYTELAMRDPLVDSWRLLGPGGICGDCSPAMLA